MQLFNAFKTSVRKAFGEIDPKWESYSGLVVCGTHSPKDLDKTVEAIREARMSGLPFLGICAGMQMMAIEYCRNVLGIRGATTQELEPDSPNAVVLQMPGLRVGISNVQWWSGKGHESHWHNYMISPDIVFKDFTLWTEGEIVEAMRLNGHKFFAGVQFHPEYQSSKDRPHPILREFLDVCKRNTN